MKRLILRHGTRDEFSGSNEKFTNANTVLVTDPPALLTYTTNRDEWKETPLRPHLSTDVSNFREFEVRRNGDRVIVRLDGKAWISLTDIWINAIFPLTIGTRAVGVGHLTI